MSTLHTARHALLALRSRGLGHFNKVCRTYCAGVSPPTENPIVSGTVSSDVLNSCNLKLVVQARIPLDQPAPNLPRAVYIKPESQIVETKITTLENGLRVASEPKYGQFCTVGVCIESGSRLKIMRCLLLKRESFGL